MAHFPFDIVGFDLDGTLIDTSGDLAAAVNHVLAGAGRPTLSVERVTTMVGDGAKRMLEQGLAATGGCEPEAFRPLYKQMLDYYATNIAVHSRPYAGALAALDALAGRGVKLGIVTNKFEAMAETLLAALGLRERFAVLIGGDTLEKELGAKGYAKPNPAGLHAMVDRCGGRRAAFVGDSSYDIDAARNAGLPGIAVRFGFLHGAVEDLGADAIIDAYEDLLPTLERLSEFI